MTSVGSKKRKRAPVVIHQTSKNFGGDTSKPTSVFQRPGQGRSSTLSIAIPGSIIDNAITLELKTILAGQIARAASVFCVDEIVVYDHGSTHKPNEPTDAEQSPGRSKAFKDAEGFFISVLSYLECPPHLRKRLFPIHPDLRCTGLVPSLDLPHHVRQREWCQYREGVSIGPREEGSRMEKKQKHVYFDGRPKRDSPQSTIVDVGFPVAVPDEIPPSARVTVKFEDEEAPRGFQHTVEGPFEDGAPPVLQAVAVDPAAPREEAGYYWGYNIRRAGSLSRVFTECPFDNGYDVSIGTSERGDSIWNLLAAKGSKGLPDTASHAVVVFGGLGGLEVAAQLDPELSERGVGKANIRDLFDFYIDICPGQGSRTIRTEEAVMISLGQLRGWLMRVLG